MSRLISVVVEKVKFFYKEGVKKVEESTWMQYGVCAGVLFAPYFSPAADITDVFNNLLYVVTLLLALAMVGIGGYTFITNRQWWSGLLSVIGLIVGVGLVVYAGSATPGGNTLGKVIYNMIVEIFAR